MSNSSDRRLDEILREMVARHGVQVDMLTGERIPDTPEAREDAERWDAHFRGRGRG